MNKILQNLRKEFASLDRGEAQLRKFGFLVGGILLLITVVVGFMKGGNIHVMVPAIGIILVVLGIILPKILRIPYLIWMGFAIVLGFFIGNIVWALLFYLLVTPIGLIMRVVRKKNNSSPNTYWITREKTWSKETMEQLF